MSLTCVNTLDLILKCNTEVDWVFVLINKHTNLEKLSELLSLFKIVSCTF